MRAGVAGKPLGQLFAALMQFAAKHKGQDRPLFGFDGDLTLSADGDRAEAKVDDRVFRLQRAADGWYWRPITTIPEKP